ncbi:hypothetical protein LK996_06580 [Lysobacter sp. A6]|uniref:Lectin n=1 Tax=Noviluteimonas lactosilytica TaxID=2888523 RepID=A0ABS8JGR7_9GAMM|nr:hypothetical protein [Lysobacter lactosilyticus]MCC8362740.1 hypothetical protein [Lysobacter lactosilyticus]
MRASLTISVLSLALACSACTGRDAANDTTVPTTATATTTEAVTPPAMSTMVPASPTTPAAPATVAAPAAPGGVMPAEGAITFAGFGPAHWGASEEQVRQAWGKDMEGAPSEPNGCFYLFPEPRTDAGYRFAFMIESSKFNRIDVRTPDIAAPGGGKVGMDKAELHRLYPGLAEQRDKYDEHALNLRGTDPQGGPGVVVFDVDASGKATEWRIGVPPQVDYVEGCS